MNRPRRDHPDMRDVAPGRIPESLIDAAMDGELDAEIQKEIGHALQYDTIRRQEFHDTRDAINALRMPIEAPDLSDRVLERAHRHRRFIPRAMRRRVKAGRVLMCTALLTTMLGVAGLQRLYPRLTTIASQQTPVSDIECAVQEDGSQLVVAVNKNVDSIRKRVAPVAGLFDQPLQRPGDNDMRFGLDLPTTSVAAMPAINQPGYALVRLVNTNAYSIAPVSRRTRIGLLADDHSSRIVLATWTSTRSASRTEPESPDDPLDLP